MSRKLIDIEDLLIWTYQKQVADKVTAKIIHGIFPQGYVSNAARLGSYARLGVRIDNPVQLFTASAEIHPDAEAVHERVVRFPALEIGLMITHAKAGDRPDWMPDAVPRCVPIRRSNGRPKMEYDAKGKRPVFCPVVYVPDPEVIDFQRRMYGVWWSALRAVASWLEDLSCYQVEGPGAPARPWGLDTAEET